MTVIDSDAHIEESVAMFEFMEEPYYGRRPLAVRFDRDTALGEHNAVWLIDGKTYPNILGKGGATFVTPTLMDRAKLKPYSIPAQELTDVDARLRDMDAVGIDQQVVYPTLFLTTTTADVELEAALFQAYNSFLGEAGALTLAQWQQFWFIPAAFAAVVMVGFGLLFYDRVERAPVAAAGEQPVPGAT